MPQSHNFCCHCSCTPLDPSITYSAQFRDGAYNGDANVALVEITWRYLGWTQVSAQPRRLTIPPEIRNRIYGLALHSAAGIDNTPILKPIKVFGPLRPLDWSTEQRQFIGLTQVCHQLRAEFLSMYQEQVNVKVDLNNIYGYVEDWVFKPDVDTEMLQGNVTIEVTKRSWVDIHGLLLLAAAAPRLKIRFAENNLKHPEMNRLFSASKEFPKLFDCIQHKVERILPQIPSDGDGWVPLVPEGSAKWTISCFRVYIKLEYAEEWMVKGFTDEDPLNWTELRDDWSSSLGVHNIYELTLQPRVWPN